MQKLIPDDLIKFGMQADWINPNRCSLINSSMSLLLCSFMLAAYTINYNDKIYEVMMLCAYDNCHAHLWLITIR